MLSPSLSGYYPWGRQMLVLPFNLSQDTFSSISGFDHHYLGQWSPIYLGWIPANVLRPAIWHVTTSPYYSQPSQAKSFNRNLWPTLIVYHAEQQDGWDQNLKWLQLVFSTAHHENCQEIPFEIIFGFLSILPLSNLWKIEELLSNSPSCSGEHMEGSQKVLAPCARTSPWTL